MRLFIAAGGQGRRLGSTVAKSMALVCGKPLIDHILEAATTAGFRDIMVGVDQGKEALVEHIRGKCEIVPDCAEPLTLALFRVARMMLNDILVCVNGDTLWAPESARWLLEQLRRDRAAGAAVLHTTICRPFPRPDLTYWKYQISPPGRVVALEDKPCHTIDTQFVMLACRRSALREVSTDWKQTFADWKQLPFHCHSLGWDFLVRLMLWKNIAVMGCVSDDLSLNVNTPYDLEMASILISNPGEFRRKVLAIDAPL